MDETAFPVKNRERKSENLVLKRNILLAVTFAVIRITVFENRKKVSFDIASEASYVYILSGQKFIKKNVENGSFWRVFENLS